MFLVGSGSVKVALVISQNCMLLVRAALFISNLFICLFIYLSPFHVLRFAYLKGPDFQKAFTV